MERGPTGRFDGARMGGEEVRAFVPNPLPPEPPLEHGMARLRGGFPLSNRLIREMHEQLLARGRGSEKQPGEFRRSQNWISGTRPGNAHFVPPPPALVDELMSVLERTFHDPNAPYPVLVTAALTHVQFETIHPFLDGNGRIGRLLILAEPRVSGLSSAAGSRRVS
jgi:Fic family protein